MISVIITATNKFGDYATPLIESIRKYEPDVEIILIDNASPKAYQPGNYRVVRFDEQQSWSHMLNRGASEAKGDWLVMLNDDVLCHGGFSKRVESLDMRSIFGPQIRHKPLSWVGKRIEYLYAWMLVMHKAIFFHVGGFDENYPAAGVDDIDFAWTAQQKGCKIRAVSLPFTHIADQPGFIHRRKNWDDADFVKRMEASRQYFAKKVNA